jgi:ABC-type glycerol-3-phosphate transport system substrate-binding protein
MSVNRKGRWQKSIVATAAALSLLMLSACSSTGSATANKKDITLIHWSWLTASDGAVWAQMINAFNVAHKGKGVQIKMQVIGDRDTYNTKMLAGVATGNAPDFGWGTGGLNSQWIKDGVLVPMNTLAKTAGLNLSDFNPAALKTASYAKYGNQFYMIPMDAMSEALEINVNQAKAAGLDINNPPKTSAELLKWAEALTVRQGGTVTRSGILMTGSGAQPTVTWGMVAGQMGFQRASGDLKTACVNPAAGKAAMQWVLDLFDKYKVSTRDVTDRYKAFATGQGSMFWTGPWSIKGNVDAGLKFVTVPLPTIGSVPDTYYELGGLEMYKQSDPTRYSATMDAIKWLSDNSYLWTTKGRGASPRSSILQKPGYLTAGYPVSERGAFISSLKFANLAPIPVLASDDFEVYSATSYLSTQVDAVIAGKKTVDQFMGAVCSRWQTDLNAG